jgi:hypothetical protein
MDLSGKPILPTLRTFCKPVLPREGFALRAPLTRPRSTEEGEAVSKRFHADSIFGPGPRVPLDREQRAQFRAKLRLQRRPGRLTIAAAEVGRVLVEMLGADGRLDPTIERVAALACVHRDTAHEALKQLRAFGFLDWTRRLVRGAATGWRAEQASNAYVLKVPSCDTEFPAGVLLSVPKKAAREGSGGWESQIAEAARQLAALGFPIPPTWGVACS